MTPEHFHDVLDRSPLFQSLGLSVVTLSADSVCLAIAEPHPTHGGAFGDLTQPGINGAVLCAALEAAIGLCGHAALGHTPAGVIELSVKLLRQVRRLPCQVTARLERQAPGLAFASAVLTNARGTPCALASGIVVATRGAAAERGLPLD
ncbi:MULTISPECIES: PaaI family thioesterase [unclassified Xanthomonas]|uniref:PaaI family thioesterase n=1 Tax=unclassified Xanthomonas TaxID=2643310 RepID=UPI00161C39CE|nr:MULTISPECIES: PaaI family thioesterase [unclassified Xanthomonas]MBB4132048.1 acyl-coenzyme A thioesterase PaaI-like protein [Xanthomonas sp. 3075]MBB5865960.1 acyl-coenzyme A thioesterase PaaI-like protein [Xanthomonas sp. 3058]